MTQKLPLSHTSARLIPPRHLAQSTLISLLINPASVLGVAVYKLSQSRGSLWRLGIFEELLTMVNVFIHKHKV